MQINLNGQVILVTGASRGIGAAIARTLAEAGATVAVHYGNSEAEALELVSKISQGAAAFQADLSQPENGPSLVAKVIAQYGRIDAVVNNAALAHALHERDDEAAALAHWRLTLDVNLIAGALISRAAIGHFADNGGGRLIHIASRAAFRGDTLEYMAYAASKGGLVAFSRSVARGYGKQNIKSFVIAPGFTRTEMAEPFIEAYGEDYVLSDLALNTLTTPEDIAPTVVFLASGYMDHATGCTIDINAGSYVR